MNTLTLAIISLIAFTTICYQLRSLRTAAIVAGGLLISSFMFGGGLFINLILSLITIALALLSVKGLRIQYISKPLFSWFRNVLPPISKTEKEAIDAGTVWWDGELFSGNPNWKNLLEIKKPSFTKEEQIFINGPVKTLCSMVNNWQINHNTSVIPVEVIQYIKDQGFLGMIIPKSYGGLEFSGMAQTEILTMVGSTGGCVTYLIAVPNSLGPGELLIKYGTEDQKDYYLPRLASGEEVPCFALTGPLVGSDATALPDIGVVSKGKYNGKSVLGIKLNFNKRYITLAPIATLIGLAFRLQDPEHLMGKVDDYGITCAMIPRDTKGVEIGRRHKPIGDAFLNGPISGKDVFIPLDYIIGGAEMAGKGWTMLVNCLSVGRCITLPSGSNSIIKHMLLGTSAYAALRQQFGLPIAKFEGVQKPLARMAGTAYIVNAARLHTAQSLSYGEKPSVPSAILKYHCTEMARQATLDAMDIHGGKAVMTGPKNYVADAYSSVPIAITVEGANILTRNLMIFGQGAIRSHPYTLKEMQLAKLEQNDDSTEQFDGVFFKHVGFTLSNAARAFSLAITGSRIAGSPGHVSLEQHYQNLSRLSAAFALVADVSMLTLQSKLKFKEMLSARLGDLLSNLYLASMVLKHHENEGCPKSDAPLVEWSIAFLSNRYQIAMLEVLQNYPNKALAVGIKAVVFPLGSRFNAPSDKLSTEIANLFTQDSETRRRLLSGTYDEAVPTNPVGIVNEVFLKSIKYAPLYQKIRDGIKRKKIKKVPGSLQIDLAKKAKVISAVEAKKLAQFDAQLMEIINVDDFDPEQLIRL